MANLDLPGRQIWGHVLGLVRGKGGHPLTGVRFRTLSTNIMHDYTGRVIGREERDVISFGNCCGLAPVQELHASRCPFLVRLSNVFFHTSLPTQRSNLLSQLPTHLEGAHRGASSAPSSVKPALFADPGGETVSSPFARAARTAAPPPDEDSQVLALRLFDASLTLTKPLGCRVVAQAVRCALTGCACPLPPVLVRRTCPAVPAQLRVHV
jgi:hypothetical protein